MEEENKKMKFNLWISNSKEELEEAMTMRRKEEGFIKDSPAENREDSTKN